MGNVSNAFHKQKGGASSNPIASAPTASAAASAAHSLPGTPATMQSRAAHAAPSEHYAASLIAHHDRSHRITEQYRALRASLLGTYGDKPFCLLITSADSGEGKTVTCLNLAVVLAGKRECRTIVVDYDLRKHRVASMLRIDNKLGVADVLRGEAKLDQVIQPTTYPNLFVIPAGQASREEAAELIGRPDLKDMLSDLRRQYDYVLLDSPPINAVADASVLGAAAGEALLVVRMNKTRRESIERARCVLESMNVKLMGMVLTHQKYYIPNCLYRYS